MKQLTVDFTHTIGKIKPMHAVNNGPLPAHAWQPGTEEAFREAGFPYARNHDASFTMAYGGEHTVDVENIFRNFDADEFDPANYEFAATDRYCLSIEAADMKVYYRLGSRIEHEPEKYHTLPPKDFAKWARICEHIIRHLCYGWADGLHLDIEYWEIWNEPDSCLKGIPNPTWQGTWDQFMEFYGVVAKHLKNVFPEKKIGGPALCGCNQEDDIVRPFLQYCAQNSVPLDFFSFHGYQVDPESDRAQAYRARKLLDEYGFSATETHLNEWNFMRTWDDAGDRERHAIFKTEKGAAFNAASMIAMQHSPLDMFMYYDAQPKNWNGLFDTTNFDKMKPYYSFWQFNKLYRFGFEVETSGEGDGLYLCAAKGQTGAAVQIVYYVDGPAQEKTVALTLKGLNDKTAVTERRIDKAHSNDIIRREVFTTAEPIIYLTLQNNTTVLLEMESL